MDGAKDTPVVEETRRFIARALTRLNVAWFGQVCRIDPTADLSERRATLERWLVAFNDAARAVQTRFDEMFMDPDCKVAMMKALEENPSLKNNATALKDLLSDTCESYIDKAVRESACEDKLKSLAEGIATAFTTEELWYEAVDRIDPEGECKVYAAKLYKEMVERL